MFCKKAKQGRRGQNRGTEKGGARRQAQQGGNRPFIKPREGRGKAKRRKDTKTLQAVSENGEERKARAKRNREKGDKEEEEEKQ